MHFGLTQRGRVAQFVIHRRAPCGRAGATLTAQGDGQPHLGRQWGSGPGPDSGGRVMQLKKCLHYPKKGPLWTFCGDANRTGLWTTSIGMSMASAFGLNSGWKGSAGENLCSLTRAGLPVEVLRRREPHRMKDNLIWDDNGGALQLYSGIVG